jgi:aspartate/methionine/tyrosine aminotransferase
MIHLSPLSTQGDEVLIFEPYFDAYKTVSTLHGIKTVGIPFEFAEDKRDAFQSSDTTAGTTFSSSDFRIDLAKLEASITSNTKMIVLNTPHNPTGKVFSREELEGICRVLERHPQVLVLSDEVYEFMCYDGLHHERIAAYPGMFDRTVSLFSAGKTFSCTGWRVGYAIAPAHLTGAITKAHSTVPFCGVTPFEVAMASCFQQMQTNGYLDELKETLVRKRDRIVGALDAANWKPIVPEGGYFVCCNVTHLPIFHEFAHIQPTNDLPKPVRTHDALNGSLDFR